MRVVLALTMATHRVPILRWTQTGRDTAPGTLPLALTISPPIAVEGDNESFDLATAACAEETAPSENTIANTAINTTNNRQRDGRLAPRLLTAHPFLFSYPLNLPLDAQAAAFPSASTHNCSR